MLTINGLNCYDSNVGQPEKFLTRKIIQLFVTVQTNSLILDFGVLSLVDLDQRLLCFLKLRKFRSLNFHCHLR